MSRTRVHHACNVAAAAVVVACASAGASALPACGDGGVGTVRGSAVDHGRALYADPKASTSPSNAFSCATCHPGDGPMDRIYSGGSLAGATARTSFWGGKRADLLEAINDCRLSFMDARTPWTADDDDARAMWAYLGSRSGPAEPSPLTIVTRAPDLPPGDLVQGKTAFGLACKPCHGTLHDGVERLVSFAPRLPDEVDASHAGLSVADRRLVFLRKIREGAFVSAAGSMPPFAREVLTDTDVASILVYLGQY